MGIRQDDTSDIERDGPFEEHRQVGTQGSVSGPQATQAPGLLLATLYGGTRVRILLYVDRLEIFHGNKQIAAHRRLYGNNKWQLDPQHYLDLIYQRPLAFDASRAIRQWRKKWPSCLEPLLCRFREKLGPSRGTREFISVLRLFKSHAPEQIVSAVKTALDAGVSSSEAVVQLLSESQPVSRFPTGGACRPRTSRFMTRLEAGYERRCKDAAAGQFEISKIIYHR